MLVRRWVASRMAVAHWRRSSAWRGAKNQAAAGVYLPSSAADVSRSAPQLMKPTPMGRTACGFERGMGWDVSCW